MQEAQNARALTRRPSGCDHAAGEHMAKTKPLPLKQQRFVDEYLADPNLNATQAYIRAGYKGRGHTAEVEASKLLRKPEIKRAISEAQAKRSHATQTDAEYVVRRLRLEAEREGEDASHAARVSALGLLGRHLGMFVDRVEIKAGVKLEVVEEIVDAPAGRQAP